MSKPDPAEVAPESVLDALEIDNDTLLLRMVPIIHAAYAKRDRTLREALKFYADEENYSSTLQTYGGQPSKIAHDAGERARAALLDGTD